MAQIFRVERTKNFTVMSNVAVLFIVIIVLLRVYRASLTCN